MVITLVGNRQLKISESAAVLLDQAMAQKVKPEYITIGGVKIKTSTITGLYPEAAWEQMEHDRKEDWKCDQGQWHARGTSCGHRPPRERVNGFEVPYVSKKTEASDKWLEIIGINLEILKKTGRYGHLRSLDDLQKYKQVEAF